MPKKRVYWPLQITHASLRDDLSDRELREELQALISYGGDIIGLTEVSGRNTILNQVARNSDMRAVTFPKGDGAILVRVAETLQVKSKNMVQAHPGKKGQYSARLVHEVELMFHKRHLWMHEANWLDGGEDDPQRAERHAQMTRTMGSEIRKHARGNKISLFGGDLNYDSNQEQYPRAMLRRHGMKVCWDDAEVQPATGPEEGHVDIIGRFIDDETVEFKRYKLHPHGHSPRRPFSVWYRIDVESKAGDPGGGGSGGGKDKDDFYATGGNIDWSDYQDDEVYNLRRAVDDSDTENG